MRTMTRKTQDACSGLAYWRALAALLGCGLIVFAILYPEDSRRDHASSTIVPEAGVPEAGLASASDLLHDRPGLLPQDDAQRDPVAEALPSKSRPVWEPASGASQHAWVLVRNASGVPIPGAAIYYCAVPEPAMERSKERKQELAACYTAVDRLMEIADLGVTDSGGLYRLVFPPASQSILAYAEIQGPSGSKLTGQAMFEAKALQQAIDGERLELVLREGDEVHLQAIHEDGTPAQGITLVLILSNPNMRGSLEFGAPDRDILPIGVTDRQGKLVWRSVSHELKMIERTGVARHSSDLLRIGAAIAGFTWEDAVAVPLPLVAGSNAKVLVPRCVERKVVVQSMAGKPVDWPLASLQIESTCGKGHPAGLMLQHGEGVLRAVANKGLRWRLTSVDQELGSGFCDSGTSHTQDLPLLLTAQRLGHLHGSIAGSAKEDNVMMTFVSYARNTVELELTLEDDGSFVIPWCDGEADQSVKIARGTQSVIMRVPPMIDGKVNMGSIVFPSSHDGVDCRIAVALEDGVEARFLTVRPVTIPEWPDTRPVVATEANQQYRVSWHGKASKVAVLVSAEGYADAYRECSAGQEYRISLQRTVGLQVDLESWTHLDPESLRLRIQWGPAAKMSAGRPVDRWFRLRPRDDGSWERLSVQCDGLAPDQYAWSIVSLSPYAVVSSGILQVPNVGALHVRLSDGSARCLRLVGFPGNGQVSPKYVTCDPEGPEGVLFFGEAQDLKSVIVLPAKVRALGFFGGSAAPCMVNLGSGDTLDLSQVFRRRDSQMERAILDGGVPASLAYDAMRRVVFVSKVDQLQPDRARSRLKARVGADVVFPCDYHSVQDGVVLKFWKFLDGSWALR